MCLGGDRVLNLKGQKLQKLYICINMYEADPRAGVNRVYTKRREGRLSLERWKVVPVWGDRKTA